MLFRKSTLPKGTSQVTTSLSMSTPSSLAASSSSICTYLHQAGPLVSRLTQAAKPSVDTTSVSLCRKACLGSHAGIPAWELISVRICMLQLQGLQLWGR